MWRHVIVTDRWMKEWKTRNHKLYLCNIFIIVEGATCFGLFIRSHQAHNISRSTVYIKKEEMRTRL